jgi:hypothetical protein
MVGHDYPLVHNIPFCIKVDKGLRNNCRNIATAQVTRALSSVEIPFNFTLKVAEDIFLRLIGLFTSPLEQIETLQTVGFVGLKFHQNVFWQCVVEPERNEVGCAFAFDVYSVAQVSKPAVSPISKSAGVDRVSGSNI